MPSFDIVLKPNTVELHNAVDQANKEISNRFDFKGSDARVELKELELTLFAEDDFKLRQVRDVITNKLTKRGVDVRFIDFTKDPEKIGGDKVKQLVPVKSGVSKELGKKLVAAIKEAKALKLSASIQGDAVRVQGAKRDALQAAMQLVKEKFQEDPLSFDNLRA